MYRLGLGRENAKESQKRKKEEERAETLKKKAEEAAAKKARKGQQRKSKKRKQGGSDEDSGKDQEKDKDHQKRKGVTRTRGSFCDSDPQVLVTGNSLPACFQVRSFTPGPDQWKMFLEEVVKNEAAILSLKKASVRKILSLSTQTADETQQAERKDWVNSTTKTFNMLQANLAASVKKISSDKVRKNHSAPQTKEVAYALGFDLLLNGLICKKRGAEGDKSKQEAWMVDRKKLADKLIEFLRFCI